MPDAALAPVGLQSRSVTARLVDGAAEVFGLVLLAAGLAAAVALVYRWYTRERVPGGLPALVGLSGVALYLNTTRALSQVIGNTGDPLDETVALFNIVTVVLSLFATRAGADVGDRVGSDLFVATGAKAVETEVSRVVQAVGRVITVELPDDVEDIVGYDPVPEETKTALAGRTFVFPRRLTVAELRDRLVTRLKADYAVGHVDLELADDGSVEYLAVGSRAAGIGPTLPPETSAVAVRADPAFAASAGDLVQVWTTDPAERVLTAELRGKVGDVVTLAVDAADTRKLDAETQYRLVTLPVESRPDREFASLLRAADETMAAVTVADGSALAGQPLGALDANVVAVRTTDGPVEPLPARDRRLASGDALYLIATPEAIRKVEAAARADVTDGAAGAGAAMPPDRRVDATTPVAAADANARGADDEAVDTLDDDEAPGIRALERDGEEGPQDTANGDGDVCDDDSREGDREEAPPVELGDPDLAPLGSDGEGDATGNGPAAPADGDASGGPDTDGTPAEDLESDETPADAPESDDESADRKDTGEDEDAAEDGEKPSAWTDLTTDGPAAASPTGPSAEDSAEASDDATDADANDDGDETANEDEDTADPESDDDADPTMDDLSDLPGADPAEFTGTDVESVDDRASADGDEDDERD